MIILGLHFGHDASVRVVKDGRVAVNIPGERMTRLKHSMTLGVELIQAVLDDAGVCAGDMDRCAASSTRTFELVFDDPSFLKIEYCRRPKGDCYAMPRINDYIPTNTWNKGQRLEAIRGRSRVNRIEGRELRRPFAPIVLEEESDSYFYASPEVSRHMPFNARVKSKDLPAISRVDFISVVRQ